MCLLNIEHVLKVFSGYDLLRTTVFSSVRFILVYRVFYSDNSVHDWTVYNAKLNAIYSVSDRFHALFIHHSAFGCLLTFLLLINVNNMEVLGS